jgi:hypothetical protein
MIMSGSKLNIELIIVAQTVSDGYYILMRGHRPNPKFNQVVSDRINHYSEALKLGSSILMIVEALGNQVRLVNDVSSIILAHLSLVGLSKNLSMLRRLTA